MRDNLPTIKEVAERAKVSVSTVSKVFNDYEDVSEDTRVKVLDAARDLNYMPPKRGRQVIKRERIGLFIEDYKPRDTSNTFIFDIMIGFKDHMAKNDYEVVLLSTTTGNQSLRPIGDIIASNDFAGAFFMGLKLNDPYYKQLQKGSFPCVLFDIPMKRKGGGSVGTDNLKGAMMATEHLLGLGHRRIGMINGHKEAHVSKERRNGFFLALNNAGVPIDNGLIYESDFTEEGGKWAMEELLSRDGDITAIFAASDLMALGAMKYLKSIGKKIPQDISVIGFDDMDIASHISPALTTIKQERYQLGLSAATLLLNLIDDQPINNIVIEPKLVTRESTAKVADQ